MRAVLAIVNQRQQKMNGAGAARPHARCELARALHGSRERIGLFVGRRARRFEQDIGPELTLEQKLRRLAWVRNDGGEKVSARRPLFAAVGQLFGQPSENQQVRLGLYRSHSVSQGAFSRAPGVGQLHGSAAPSAKPG